MSFLLFLCPFFQSLCLLSQCPPLFVFLSLSRSVSVCVCVCGKLHHPHTPLMRRSAELPVGRALWANNVARPVKSGICRTSRPQISITNRQFRTQQISKSQSGHWKLTCAHFITHTSGTRL